MAGQGKTTFIAGDILTASQVNGFLMDQVVQVYSGTAARGSALPVPDEGMMTYLADTDKLQLATGTATYVDVYPAVPLVGQIRQVVSTTKTNTFSAAIGTAGNFSSNVTGLEATITPTSATSKILVSVSIAGARADGRALLGFRIMRDATAVGVGAAAGVRAPVTSAAVNDTAADQHIASIAGQHLDSPNTTSSITYGVQLYGYSASTFYLNRTGVDTNTVLFSRPASNITVMEVLA
jgi:hypothetical protein